MRRATIHIPTGDGSNSCYEKTEWDVIARAALDDAAAQNQLLERYYHPLKAALASQLRWGPHRHDVEDILHEFFAHISSGGVAHFFSKADHKKGKFRTYLRVHLEYFLLAELSRKRAKKRGGQSEILPLDLVTEDERLDKNCEIPGQSSYHDHLYAFFIVNKVFAKLEPEKLGRAGLLLRYFLSTYSDYYSNKLDDDKYAHIKSQLLWRYPSEGALRKALSRMRAYFSRFLKEEVARTLTNPTPNDVYEETRNVLRNWDIGRDVIWEWNAYRPTLKSNSDPLKQAEEHLNRALTIAEKLEN